MDNLTTANILLDQAANESDHGAGKRALDAVESFLARFVSYPSEAARVAHVLWIGHTHLIDRFESTPRLAFLSPEPGSGKTRAMEVTETLVPSPVSAVNVSPSYLFRKVGGEETVTVLFDEIDTVFGPKAKENEEIRGLLNAGHRRGAVAGRCVVRGKEIVTEEIPAFSAVALAGLGWLPDTILSRSVVVRMRRRHNGERIEPFRHRVHSAEGAKVRGLLELWARNVPDTIEWPVMPEGVQDRDADVWEPLLAVAEMVGSSWPERARAAAVAFVTAKTDAEPSLGVRLLSDLKVAFGESREMSTKALLAALHEIDEAPWANLRGKPLDERGLALRLRQYSVTSRIKWFGTKQARGYERADLEDAWARYLPQCPDKHVTSVTAITTAATVTPVMPVMHLSDDGRDGATCACCGFGGDTIQAVGGDGVEARLHRDCIEHFFGPQGGAA